MTEDPQVGGSGAQDPRVVVRLDGFWSDDGPWRVGFFWWVSVVPDLSWVMDPGRQVRTNLWAPTLKVPVWVTNGLRREVVGSRGPSRGPGLRGRADWNRRSHQSASEYSDSAHVKYVRLSLLLEYTLVSHLGSFCRRVSGPIGDPSVRSSL